MEKLWDRLRIFVWWWVRFLPLSLIVTFVALHQLLVTLFTHKELGMLQEFVYGWLLLFPLSLPVTLVVLFTLYALFSTLLEPCTRREREGPFVHIKVISPYFAIGRYLPGGGGGTKEFWMFGWQGWLGSSSVQNILLSPVDLTGVAPELCEFADAMEDGQLIALNARRANNGTVVAKKMPDGRLVGFRYYDGRLDPLDDYPDVWYPLVRIQQKKGSAR